MNELLKKMNYKKGAVHVAGAPDGFYPILAGWKAEVIESADLKPAAKDEKLSFLLVFTASEAEVKAKIPPLAPMVGPSTVFWVAFPKKTSPRYDSDINRRNVAIDDDWSALRFAPL
jgi:hypothetical protein